MPKKIRLTAGRLAEFRHEGDGNQTFLWDTDVSGLAVRATAPSKRNPNGAKAFIFESRFNGQTIRLTIGSLKDWDLDKARAQARVYKTDIDNGRDPRAVKAEVTAADQAANTARKEARAEEKRKQHFTLKAMCEAYCAGLRAKDKVKPSTDALSAFRVHVFNSEYANLPAKNVTSKQLTELVRKVHESGKVRTAGILRNYLVAAYNTARRAPFDPKVSSELIKFDVTTNPAEVVAAIPVTVGERTLSVHEFKQYMEALGDTPVDQLLKAHLYIGGQRMVQLTRATVGDFSADSLTIKLLDPKGRRQTARVHLIPLAQKGAEIVTALELARKDTPDAKLFGASHRDAGDRVSEIYKQLKIPKFTVADIRRTCETMLAGLGISKDIRAQLLSHGLGGVQDKHYDKHDYSDEKRQALSIWESRLDEILKGEKAKSPKVVGLGRWQVGN